MVQIIFLALLVLSSLNLQPPVHQINRNDEWLRQRYFEALTIKEGMTRADLLKVFRMDGGLQPLLPTRYVLKSSNMIKVDVEFDVPASARIIPEDLRREMEQLKPDARTKSDELSQFQILPNQKLRIRSISRPYIEQFNLD